MSVTFKNDNDVTMKILKDHPFTNDFVRRDDHEVAFRRVHSYLIKNGLIKNNIIDLGAWIGDNSIPWSLQIDGAIYAIDPSSDNINFINQMMELNGIKNIITIQKPISDRNEFLYTNSHINHCSFINTVGLVGLTRLEAVSLDHLYRTGVIDNIGYIHLDVEGLESKVIIGSDDIIEKFRPIITFEQHLNADDYIFLSMYLSNKGYDVYLINEMLPGCNFDCRNLIAFPRKLHINIDDIHRDICQVIMLLVSPSNGNMDLLEGIRFSATIFGNGLSGNEYNNVMSIKDLNEDDAYLFPVHDNNYTKIIAINGDGSWIGGKYLLGYINIKCPKTVTDAYHSAYGTMTDRYEYNIKNVKMSR